MPRQPLKLLIPFDRKPDLTFSHFSHARRPPAMAFVANCIATWSYIEAEVAVIFGFLLGANNEAALAVFQTLRQSGIQRRAIEEAAKPRLNETEMELLRAILQVHRALESDRNDLAHGIIGTCEQVPNGILWLPTGDQVLVRLKMLTEPGFETNDAGYRQLYDSVYVYRHEDLVAIMREFILMWEVWFQFLTYLEERDPELFSQLQKLPRIAQAIETDRARNNRATPSQSPPLEANG